MPSPKINKVLRRTVQPSVPTVPSIKLRVVVSGSRPGRKEVVVMGRSLPLHPRLFSRQLLTRMSNQQDEPREQG